MVDIRTRNDRVAVVREAHLVDGRIWSNGLGFSRHGWEYACTFGKWSAAYRTTRTHLYGEGHSPLHARLFAHKVGV